MPRGQAGQADGSDTRRRKGVMPQDDGVVNLGFDRLMPEVPSPEGKREMIEDVDLIDARRDEQHVGQCLREKALLFAKHPAVAMARAIDDAIMAGQAEPALVRAEGAGGGGMTLLSRGVLHDVIVFRDAEANGEILRGSTPSHSRQGAHLFGQMGDQVEMIDIFPDERGVRFQIDEGEIFPGVVDEDRLLIQGKRMRMVRPHGTV